jgi:hypothetical protein
VPKGGSDSAPDPPKTMPGPGHTDPAQQAWCAVQPVQALGASIAPLGRYATHFLRATAPDSLDWPA